MAMRSNCVDDEHSAFKEAVAAMAIVETIVILAALMFVAALIVPNWLVPPDHAQVLIAHPHLTAINLESTVERRYSSPQPP